MANLGDAQAEALVTVMPGAGQDPVVTTLVLPARSQTRVRVGDVLAVPDPGVVVEVFGGRPVVEHLLRRGDDVALGPCAREPSTRRLFAAGTTVKGAELWLELFNPFEEDAIVDATFFTEGGFQAPEALQGLGVPRRSKVVVPVHDHVRREAHVATEVRTRVGRVVAEQTIAFDGTDGRRGLGLSVGAGAPGESWTFPYGRLVEGAGELVAVVNPDLGTTEVDVVAHLEGDAVVEPQTLAVPGRSVAVVNLAEWLPVETLHAVEVQVTGRQPVMAEGLWSYSASSGEAGVALAGERSRRPCGGPSRRAGSPRAPPTGSPCTTPPGPRPGSPSGRWRTVPRRSSSRRPSRRRPRSSSTCASSRSPPEPCSCSRPASP
ncbi:MAG: DUF5719 family protein [Acidimicrobiia bacterium]|nr:DUF5719 family protein [Acidimicrobiia bacterium]